MPKPRDPLHKQWSGCGARVITTGGRQAAGRRKAGGVRAVRGRSNYDICGSLLAINSARNVVLIPPPRTHKRRKPQLSSRVQPTSTARQPVIVDIITGARAGSGGGGSTEGRQGEVLEALADQERVELARQG